MLLVGMLAACGQGADTPADGTAQSLLPSSSSTAPALTPVATFTPTPAAPRTLTICQTQEPRSLFYYDAVSTAERNVLAALYDGPFELDGFTVRPVLLEKLPSLADGDALLQAVTVAPGDRLVDATGQLVNLAEGVLYRPSGCLAQACAQVYAGDQPVQVDALLLRFQLLSGLQWSDGVPLTAADSVYSYEVVRSLYPRVWPERLMRTQAYWALDERTIEYTGVPGDMDGLYHARFYPPLPQHAWGGLSAQDLPTAVQSTRQPLGWGAYVLQEWVAGEQITLARNPLYFRAAEGLPHFDTLVYRFLADGDAALTALLAGECDLIDETAGLQSQAATLSTQQAEGSLTLIPQTAVAWETLTFGVASLEPGRPDFFGQVEVRRGIAQCIDRPGLATLFTEGQTVAESYLPAGHPLYNPPAVQYPYDPQAGANRLQATGWLDLDGDPATPRTAQGVTGVPDGTAFIVEYLVSPDAGSQAVAQRIQAGLADCGIQADLVTQDPQVTLAAGPQGPVFGRQFDLAQVAWQAALEPPCDLYLTNQIPGAYPEYSLGWGGMNASGYSRLDYDQACAEALYSLPDQPLHAQAHAQAQALFAADLPALPLYWHARWLVARPDLCGISPSPLPGSLSAGLEQVEIGDGCTGD